MKVYKLEIMIIDFDGIGEDEMKSVLENANYPNDCISPDVMNVKCIDIGEWEDDNKLNFKDTRANEYKRLFNPRLLKSRSNR
jgi:hypothetical protein